MRTRPIACAFLFCGGGFFAFGQTQTAAPVLTVEAEVLWHDRGFEGAPVGAWCPVDAFYLDELPWGHFEAPSGSCWPAAVQLVST